MAVGVSGDHPNRPIPQLTRIGDFRGMNDSLMESPRNPGWFTQVGECHLKFHEDRDTIHRQCLSFSRRRRRQPLAATTSALSHHSDRKRRNMNIRRKSARAFISIPLAVLPFILGTGVAHAASTNGAAGQMPAFYDGLLNTVNMKEMPDGASAALLAHNASVNTIYASNDLDEEQDFIPVIDAIQGDGFNPLWHQVLIVFNAGFTPHQFFSDDEVLAAAAGPNPEISLDMTDEVYRCSVVKQKSKP